jgi:Uma2 family endonuclease
MTEAEYLALDDAEETDLEYVDGVAVEKGVVDRNHRAIAGQIDGWFWQYWREHGGEFGPEGRVRLPAGNRRKPDAAYFVAGTHAGDDAIPTIAVEVRSPGDTMAAQRRKCREYREAGVLACWLIDPISRTDEVFEDDLDGEPLPVDGAITSRHLPGFELPLADLFAVLER